MRYFIFLGILLLVGCAPKVAPVVPVAVVEKIAPPPPAKEDVVRSGIEAPPTMTQDQVEALWVRSSAYAPEHEVLEELVGNFTTTAKMFGEEGAPPEVSPGRSVFSALFDGRFIKEEFTSETGGARFEGLGIMGYDTLEDLYTSLWMDSMNTATLILRGKYDAPSKTFTWNGTRYDPFLKQRVHIRAYTKIPNKDEHVYEMQEGEPDGSWKTTLEVTYLRKK